MRSCSKILVCGIGLCLLVLFLGDNVKADDYKTITITNNRNTSVKLESHHYDGMFSFTLSPRRSHTARFRPDAYVIIYDNNGTVITKIYPYSTGDYNIN